MPPAVTFHRWSAEHLWPLVITAAAAVAVICYSRSRRATPRGVKAGAVTLALLLIGREVAKAMVLTSTHEYNVQTSLPLHVCDLTLFATAWALLTRQQFAYEIAYFFGLGATPLALVTPDLRHAFPSVDYSLFFVGHCGIVLAVVYLTFPMQMRPRRSSIPHMMLAACSTYSLWAL